VKRSYNDFNANFEEEEVNKIQNACNILTKVLMETRHDNRDTQILNRIVEQLNWIIEQQYK